MKKQVAWYLAIIMGAIILNIALYWFIAKCLFEIADHKDSLPLLIGLLTVTTAVPTYFYTRMKDIDAAKLDVAKSNSLKNLDARRQLYEDLIPYLFIKSSPANLTAYSALIPEASAHIARIFDGAVLSIQELTNHRVDQDRDPKQSPRFQVFTFAQSQISLRKWRGNIYFSIDMIARIEAFNRIGFTEDESNPHIHPLQLLLGAIKSELDQASLD